MSEVTVLRIAADGESDILTIDQTLQAWRDLLDGGHLEVISGDGWTAYLDEDGKYKDLPNNDVATRLARRHGWRGFPWDVLAGPVVFMGLPDAKGDETSVPHWLTAEVSS